MRPFVRGDVDGFFGLALDNLVQLLLIDALCRGVIGMPAELLYGRPLETQRLADELSLDPAFVQELLEAHAAGT